MISLGKKFLANGMRKEVDRCQLVLEEALKGQTVAIVSSGDAGVYGMAGIMHEVAADHPEIPIEVVFRELRQLAVVQQF
jgi:precorrin-3B C17-methyltransferase